VNVIFLRGVGGFGSSTTGATGATGATGSTVIRQLLPESDNVCCLHLQRRDAHTSVHVAAPAPALVDVEDEGHGKPNGPGAAGGTLLLDRREIILRVIVEVVV
jgi:hypothetical protein